MEEGEVSSSGGAPSIADKVSTIRQRRSVTIFPLASKHKTRERVIQSLPTSHDNYDEAPDPFYIHDRIHFCLSYLNRHA